MARKTGPLPTPSAGGSYVADPAKGTVKRVAGPDLEPADADPPPTPETPPAQEDQK